MASLKSKTGIHYGLFYYLCIFMYVSLHLFDPKYSKNSNIVKY